MIVPQRASADARGLAPAAALAAVLLAGLACGPPEEEQVADDTADPAAVDGAPDDVLFTAYALNFAWGFRAEGCAIRRDGVVVEWAPRPTDDGSSSQTRRGVTGDEMGSVPAETVAAMARLVPEAASGPVERSDAGMRDAGAVVFAALDRDGDTETRSEVTLLQSGDWKAVNRSSAARTLVRWMSRALEPWDCPDPRSWLSGPAGARSESPGPPPRPYPPVDEPPTSSRRTPPASGRQNAGMPVMSWPRIRPWMS